jgi:hypothetical protein
MMKLMKIRMAAMLNRMEMVMLMKNRMKMVKEVMVKMVLVKNKAPI